MTATISDPGAARAPPNEADLARIGLLRRFALVTGAITATIGAVYLAFWLFGVPPRWSARGAVTMKTNMALALAMAGASLLLLQPGRVTARRRSLAVLLAWGVLLLGALTSVEHLLGVDLGIDQLIAREPPGQPGAASANRMGLPGAMSLVSLAAGLLAIASDRRAAAWLGAVTGILVLVPAIGFLYGIGPLYGASQLANAPWPTAVALLSLSVGVSLVGSGEGSVMLRDDPGGVVMRRMALPLALVPIAIGFVRLLGERSGLYERHLGTGLFAVSLSTVSFVLLWRSAVWLSAAAADRGRAEQESRWRASLLDVAHDAIFVWSAARGIESWNHGAEELYGYKAAEAVGRSPRELLQTAGGWSEIEAELDRTGRWEGELVHRTGAGAEIAISSKLQKVRGADGQPRILESNRDISEANRAAEQLRASEQRLRLFIEDAPTAVAMLDREMRYLAVSKRFLSEYGIADRDVIGRSHYELFPDLAEHWKVIHRRCLAGAVEKAEEEAFPRADGATEWIRWKIQPWRTAAGEVGGLILFSEIITERKRAREVLAAREREARQRASELEAILGCVADGVSVLDREGRIVRTNRAADRIYERLRVHSHEEPVAVRLVRWGRRVSEDGRELAPDEVPAIRALNFGETVRDAVIGFGREELVWLRVSAAPLVVAGEQTGAVVSLTDVTERKRIEQAQRESDERFRQLADAMPQVVWTSRPDGTVDYYNGRVQELSGATQREDGTWTWHPMLHPDDAGPTVEAWERAIRTGEVYEISHRVRRADGTLHWYLSRGVPARDGEGRIARWYGTATDIDAQKRAEEALREADHRKNEFLAMLSHELRNPLAPIGNSVFILERAEPGGAQAKRALGVIDRQVHHLTRLIDDLLDVTRVSRGKIRLQRERLDVCALARRTAEDHASLFRAGEVRLEVSDCGAPLYVNADPTRLAQVIGNLLTNAAKFTRAGGRVDLRVSAEGGMAKIGVRDDGAGIAPGLLNELFKPFVQADATLDRSKGGLGLGLALVKGLVEMHGGSVAAASAGPGKGAEFTVRIPLEGAEAVATDAALGPEAERVKRLRVVVIEDNADAAESLKEALELNGHEVETAVTGFEGIEKARRFHPDVVLCDLGLPGIDGFEVARRMRADAGLRSAPLVALSGYAAPEDVERSHEAGFVKHLAKPPDLGALERTLTEALEAGRPH